ncbi:hypothetical protein Trydic_g5490 [Trypoxylus dichotomus]
MGRRTTPSTDMETATPKQASENTTTQEYIEVQNIWKRHSPTIWMNHLYGNSSIRSWKYTNANSEKKAKWVNQKLRNTWNRQKGIRGGAWTVNRKNRNPCQPVITTKHWQRTIQTSRICKKERTRKYRKMLKKNSHKNEGKNKTARPQQQEEFKHKVAPIIIKETVKWTKTSNLMKRKNITATKCKPIQTGIQVKPATKDDYRKLSKMLKEEENQFCTFRLKSEKKLKVVLRGITQDITDEEIKDDLQQQDYPVEKISWMKGRNGRTNRGYPHAYANEDVLDLVILKNVTTPYCLENIKDLSSDHLPVIMTVSIESSSIQQTIHTINWQKIEKSLKLRPTYISTDNDIDTAEKIPPILGTRGIISNNSDKTEEFANYFEWTFRPNPPVDTDHEKFTDVINKQVHTAYRDTINVQETTTKELWYIIKTIADRKAPGHDGITNTAIKHLTSEAVDTLK